MTFSIEAYTSSLPRTIKSHALKTRESIDEQIASIKEESAKVEKSHIQCWRSPQKVVHTKC